MKTKFVVECSFLNHNRFLDKEFENKGRTKDFEEAENYLFEVINNAVRMNKLQLYYPESKRMVFEKFSPGESLAEVFKHKIRYPSSPKGNECIKLFYIEGNKKYSIIEIKNLDYDEIVEMVKSNRKISRAVIYERAKKMNSFYSGATSFFDLHFDFNAHYDLLQEQEKFQKLYNRNLGILRVSDDIKVLKNNSLGELFSYVTVACNTNFSDGSCMVKINKKEEAFALLHFMKKILNVCFEMNYVHIIEEGNDLFFLLIKPKSFRILQPSDQGVLQLTKDGKVIRVTNESAISDLPYYPKMSDWYERDSSEDLDNYSIKQIMDII